MGVPEEGHSRDSLACFFPYIIIMSEVLADKNPVIYLKMTTI